MRQLYDPLLTDLHFPFSAAVSILAKKSESDLTLSSRISWFLFQFPNQDCKSICQEKPCFEEVADSLWSFGIDVIRWRSRDQMWRKVRFSSHIVYGPARFRGSRKRRKGSSCVLVRHYTGILVYRLQVCYKAAAQDKREKTRAKRVCTKDISNCMDCKSHAKKRGLLSWITISS